MLLRKISSLSILLLITVLLSAVNENAGTTGFNNLQVIYSAKAISMSKAMTGIPASLEGLQLNPAAILRIDDMAISSTFNNYLVDTNGGGLHFLHPSYENISFGISLHYLNFGEIDRTEVTPDNEYLETGETFGASNLIFGVSAAREMNDAIDLGVTLKYVYDQIDKYSASAIVADLGLIHHPVNEKIKVGLAIRNLGFQTGFYTQEKYTEKLPFTFAAGLSYQFNPKFLGALDISKPKGTDLTGRFGVEYLLHPMLTLRAGYNANSGDWKTGGSMDWAAGATFGAGFNWSNYFLDYGVASFGDLGFVNQLSLQYRF